METWGCFCLNLTNLFQTGGIRLSLPHPYPALSCSSLGLSHRLAPFSSFLLIEKNANFTPFLYIAVKALLFPLKHNFTSLHFKSVVLLSSKQGAPSRMDTCKRRLKWPHHPDQERRRPLVTSPHHFQSSSSVSNTVRP